VSKPNNNSGSYDCFGSMLAHQQGDVTSVGSAAGLSTGPQLGGLIRMMSSEFCVCVVSGEVRGCKPPVPFYPFNCQLRVSSFCLFTNAFASSL
jgi:hypothetical protein